MNINRLRGKIAENGYSIPDFSQKIGIKKATFYRKLKRQTEFTRSEIESISIVLNLSAEQIKEIFFDEKVS